MPRWFKASASDSAQGCVMVAHLDDGRVALRDSKDPGRLVFVYTADEWIELLVQVAHGTYPAATRQPDGEVLLTHPSRADLPAHRFTAHEWRCFLVGVTRGEFTFPAVPA